MKIALISGANKGIGFETARQLGAKGVHVLIGARNATSGQDAVKTLQDEGYKADYIELDVSKEDSVKEAAKAVTEKYGKLDILVNNAGVNPEPALGMFSFEQLSLDVMMDTYQTNVFGPFMMIREFLPLLRKSDAGRIVNVSSTLGSLADQSDPNSYFYQVNNTAYNSSKTALNALTVQLAKQTKDTNIKVNSACPGWVQTDMGGPDASRTVEQGANIIIKLATLPNDGPTGLFFDDNGEIKW